MAIGDYTKTTYVDGTTITTPASPGDPKINDINLNNAENKIDELDTWAATADTDINTAQADIITNATNITTLLAIAKNCFVGLDVTNAADTDHDITIAAGYCVDSTGAYSLYLPSAMTKQIDAAWAAGTNAGGLFSGTVANSTCYYKILIRKDSDGSIDWGYDTSITAANKPAGYTYYRVVGSVWTNTSANIRNGKYNRLGRMFHCQYNDFILDRAYAALGGTSRTLITTSVPPNSYGIYCILFNGTAASSYVNYGSAYETDSAPSSFDTAKMRIDSGDGLVSLQCEYLANASSQIYVRADTGSGVSVGVKTEGYAQIL